MRRLRPPREPRRVFRFFGASPSAVSSAPFSGSTASAASASAGSGSAAAGSVAPRPVPVAAPGRRSRSTWAPGRGSSAPSCGACRLASRAGSSSSAAPRRRRPSTVSASPRRRRPRRRPRPSTTSSASTTASGAVPSFFATGLRVGFSASPSAVIGVAPSFARRDDRRVCGARHDALDLRLHLLADELRRAGDDDVVAVELRDGGLRIVQADLDRLQLERRALGERRVRRDRLELPLLEHEEVVEVDVLLRDEEEAPARRRLDLLEAGRARTDQQRRDLRVHLDAIRLNARAACERSEPALEIDRGRLLGDDDPVAAARRALAREDLARALGDVLPRHLDEAERRDLDDVGLRPVAFELRAQRVLDGLAVLRVRHVDEVDDDDPADVAQAELPDDLLHRFEVVLRDRVLEPRRRRLRARADEAARVHVDHGERLGVVEDEIAAGREVDAPGERRADLGVDAVVLEQRFLLLVAEHALDHVRRRLLQVAGDPPVRLLVVDVRVLEVLREEVARHAQRQLGLLVDERRRLRLLRLRLDRLPELLQEDEVALDVLGARALGCGADDDAALLHVELLQDVLQARALVVLEPARDAEALAVRHEHDEAAGQRDLHRQPRALRLHRILHGLDEDLLAAAQQILDPLAVTLALELGADDLVHVQEAVPLEADLDERGLHAREDVVDDAEVDVSGDRAPLGPLEVDLGDAVVLEDGDALLAHVDRDEELALRGRQRRAARQSRGASRRGRRVPCAAGPAAPRPASGRAPLCPWALSPWAALRSRRRRRWPLASLASARAAAALGPCSCVCIGYGRCCGRAVRCFGKWSGGLCRRLLPLRLAPAKPR